MGSALERFRARATEPRSDDRFARGLGKCPLASSALMVLSRTSTVDGGALHCRLTGLRAVIEPVGLGGQTSALVRREPCHLLSRCSMRRVAAGRQRRCPG